MPHHSLHMCALDRESTKKTKMTPPKLWVSPLAGLLLLSAITAHAGPITFTFTGSVTADAINGCGVVVNCGAVTGSYTFDSAAADLNPSLNAGLYAAAGITFSIDATPFFSSPDGSINVANFAAVDQYGVLATGTASNLSIAVFSFLLTDPTAAAFNSDALPLNASALTPMLPGAFQLNAADDTFQLLGTIDNISSVSTSPVPEPGTFWLTVAFVAAILLRIYVPAPR